MDSWLPLARQRELQSILQWENLNKAKALKHSTYIQAMSFLTEIFTQSAFLMGIISLVGLLALRSPVNKLLTRTLKTILGYLMLSAGADIVVANLNPLGVLSKQDLVSVV